MKRNLLTILILALVLVNMVLTAIMMFSVMGTNRKTAELVSNIAAALSLELTVPGEEEEEVVVPLSNLEVWNLEGTMTIPVRSDDGGNHYIRFVISFSMNTKTKGYKTYGSDIANYESVVKDTISTTVSQHTLAECQNDFESIREAILQNVRELFDPDGKDFIYNVAINDIQYG